MSEEIKLGSTSFLRSALVGITLAEAKEMFKHIDSRKVETAWKEANPETKEPAHQKPNKAKVKEEPEAFEDL